MEKNKKDKGDALSTGTILSGSRFKYTIKKVLGRGSFGITYLATIKLQGELGTITSKVAVKEFFMGDINGRNGSQVTAGNKEGMVQDYRNKFIREARNLGEVNHENIINVMEVFEENGTVYYAMQYIEGGSLDDRIRQKGKLSEEETIEMSRKMADALKSLHARGMLHLDIKPSNVMLTDDLNPILIDFGLAKHFDDGGVPESSTKIGAGTPGYAPVEQASYRIGKGIPWTMDVYALGATMFKMLTGKRPPEASMILNQIENPMDYLKAAGVSDEISKIVVKCMAALIRDRYQNMGELLNALDGEQSTEESAPVAMAEVVSSQLKDVDNVPQPDVIQAEVIAAVPEKAKTEEKEKSAPKIEKTPVSASTQTEVPPVKQPKAEEKPVPQPKVKKKPIAEKKPDIEKKHEPKPKVENIPEKKSKADTSQSPEETLIVSPTQSAQASTPPPPTSGRVVETPVSQPLGIKEDESPKKKKNTIVIIGGFVVGLIIVGLILFLPKKSSENESTEPTEMVESSEPNIVKDVKMSSALGSITYTGEVNEAGNPDGKGVGIFTDGTKYDGDWVDGVMEGDAVYTLSNGDVFEGKWKNNAYSEGKYTSKSDGSYYSGKFKNGEGYQGGGNWYDKSGNVIPW